VGIALDIRIALRAALLVLVALSCLVGASNASAAPTKHGLSATYYDDPAFRRPVLNRVDARVNFAWRTASPARRIARDTFSARWRGFVVAPRGGRYTFTTRASDGVRVWIDGRLRIARWSRTARARTNATTLTLARGRHAIRIDFF
jgi:hypothetical protein